MSQVSVGKKFRRNKVEGLSAVGSHRKHSVAVFLITVYESCSRWCSLSHVSSSQKQNKNRLSVTLYKLPARNHWQQYECLVRDDTLTTTHSGQNRKGKWQIFGLWSNCLMFLLGFWQSFVVLPLVLNGSCAEDQMPFFYENCWLVLFKNWVGVIWTLINETPLLKVLERFVPRTLNASPTLFLSLVEVMPLSNVLRHDLHVQDAGCWTRGVFYVVKYILPLPADILPFFFSRRRKNIVSQRGCNISLPLSTHQMCGCRFSPPIRRRWRNAVGCRRMGTSSICCLHSSRQLCLSVSSDRSLSWMFFTHGFVALFACPICSWLYSRWSRQQHVSVHYPATKRLDSSGFHRNERRLPRLDLVSSFFLIWFLQGINFKWWRFSHP